MEGFGVEISLHFAEMPHPSAEMTGHVFQITVLFVLHESIMYVTLSVFGKNIRTLVFFLMCNVSYCDVLSQSRALHHIVSVAKKSI